jgi:hypothetical protein
VVSFSNLPTEISLTKFQPSRQMRNVSSWIKFSPILEKYFISFIQRMEIFPYFFRENFTRGKLNDRENKNKFP